MPTTALPDEETRGVSSTRRPSRSQVITGIVAYALTLLVTGLLVTGGNARPSAPTSTPTPAPRAPVVAAPQRDEAPPMSDEIPPIPDVEKVVQLDPLRQESRVKARDNGQSVRYGDHSVWVFADTVLTKPDAFLSNTAVSTSDLDASDGITLTAGDLSGTGDGTVHDEFLPWSSREKSFEKSHARNCLTEAYCQVTFGLWPGPVIADQANHRVLVFYHKLCRGGAPGEPCSQRYGQDLGTGVAAVDMTTYEVTRLTPANGPGVSSIEGRDPTLFFPAGTLYASEAVLAGDDVYVYGDCTADSRCRVARVPLDRLTDRSAWRFYGGRDDDHRPIWSDDPADAVATIHAGAAGNSVFFDPALKAWMNVYMEFGSHELDAQVGGSPYGPWSAPFTIADTDAGAYGANYAAFAHPEYAQRNGLIQYVTYYQQSTGAQRLLRITLSP
ncbi:DUF4185 domain-containing protein [Cryptosporangium phraense]|uniref:DUF4185 domain-containing protein n=1 Tax=Cryptosporangium phraense TaxID=2593070 RepID=A0A545AZQ5_9ACTN|nr:DUF4185 domain-containing protein [Cryptosporangium phraense]TQS46810.1 DUF4185 domain-containing protein [Cryptosporangium phraense]